MIVNEPSEEQGTCDVTGVIPIAADEREPTLRITRPIRLVCVVGTLDLGRTFRIGAGSVVIGRGATEVQLRATDVSRNHARISDAERGHVIEDLNSSNGTFVNGARITRKTPLEVGDRIQIGNTVLVFTLHDELEERMRQLQRVEAMTSFAGGLAHDFNNTLMVITGGLSLLRDRADKDPELGEMLAELTQATNDASDLVKRLLRLGRPDPITFEKVRLSGVIERAVAQARRVMPDNIEVTFEILPDLRVHGSTGELHQAVLNLMINARDAMPSGGRLTIWARAIRLDRAAAGEQLVGEGDFVDLRVRDTGIGMDETVLARAFEPFFTTKAPGKGTGLGLAMIHQIVRNHHGAISVQSTQGRGTEFRILLPRG